LAVRHRELLREAALDRDPEQLVEPVLLARHVARDEERATVRVPVDEPVRRGVVGDPARRAAGCRDHVDVDVAVVVAAERDFAAVRREAREGLLTCGRGQAVRHAALLRHDPDVAAVDESDVRGGNVGVAQQAGIHLRGKGGRERQQEGRREESAYGEARHFPPPGLRCDNNRTSMRKGLPWVARGCGRISRGYLTAASPARVSPRSPNRIGGYYPNVAGQGKGAPSKAVTGGRGGDRGRALAVPGSGASVHQPTSCWAIRGRRCPGAGA